MLSRPHPRYGWLYLQPADWRASFQRQIEERDRLNDLHNSGPPPEWCRWVDEYQMPSLASRPHYQKQFSDRVSELVMQLAGLQQQIAGGRHDLEPAANACRGEIDWITALVEVAV